MAKIDIANEIVEEFPDRGYEANQLTTDHTEKELIELQSLLRTERDQVVNETTPQSEVEDLTTDEIVQALVEGKVISGNFKLADPRTHYAENGFTLVGEQEKSYLSSPPHA
ncbi:hypothetical protein [Peribacillus frigoritolerans]|uniref:hypothetical protein n=1 Tax=Peribacillus frigoritolerans TaxID=450367 RepID=UPI00207944C2|nr:hypothetical protein [Peribacillus frigoritolerans]USK77924.1 hypothetical protein LIT31_26965 [Peribacillus frigoritolerans]